MKSAREEAQMEKRGPRAEGQAGRRLGGGERGAMSKLCNSSGETQPAGQAPIQARVGSQKPGETRLQGRHVSGTAIHRVP